MTTATNQDTAACQADNKRCIQRLRARFERWELDHLRSLAADLAERLEAAESQLAWTESAAEMWQQHATELQEELLKNSPDASIGLTQQGRIVIQHSAPVPDPGQPWPEQGGIYIGIAPAEGGLPMRHVVALDAAPPADTMTWRKGMDWAASLGNGANLPTQIEAIMARNVALQAFPGNWYWTSTQYSRTSAFVQSFEYGYSDWYNKDDQRRVRAFRGLALDTFTPLTLEGGAK